MTGQVYASPGRHCIFRQTGSLLDAQNNFSATIDKWLEQDNQCNKRDPLLSSAIYIGTTAMSNDDTQSICTISNDVTVPRFQETSNEKLSTAEDKMLAIKDCTNINARPSIKSNEVPWNFRYRLDNLQL